MSAPRIRLGCLLSLLVASSASGLTIDWTFVGDPGNPCQVQSQDCFGSVGYEYYIGTYEVTNAQYVEFLNAKAATDPLRLYSANMGSGYGGITRSGSDGSYTYAPISGRADMPVNFVTFYDAMRFANWLQNGQGNGDTEMGAYTLLGGTPSPSNGRAVTRNAGATFAVPTEDEWYKAAYYDRTTSQYFSYPTGSGPTVCSAPTGSSNSANCNNAVSDYTPVGSYPGSESPYGTFDQGGNIWELDEQIVITSRRVIRGGAFDGGPGYLAASYRTSFGPDAESAYVGFRLAYIPEPGTGLLVIAGLLGLAGWRRARA